MYTGSEETQCTNCDHREVCSLMGQLLNAQKAINEVTVTIGDKSIKYLHDFDWIKRVKLECIHYSGRKNPAIRGDILP